MAFRWAGRSLDYTDLISEAAAAVFMVVIINGYVSLEGIRTEIHQIIFLIISACVAWGLIDGLTYAIGSSIDRGNQANLARKIQSEKNSDQAIEDIVGEFDGTYLSNFSEIDKRSIATEVLKKKPLVSDEKKKFITSHERNGLLSIMGIYLVAAGLLIFPYLIFPNRLDAWVLSNLIGIGWLFQYGYNAGKITGTKRILAGLLTSSVGIIFLILVLLMHS